MAVLRGSLARRIWQTCIQRGGWKDVIFEPEKKVIITELPEDAGFTVEDFEDCVLLVQVKPVGCRQLGLDP